MKKFYQVKEVSKEDTPVLLRLERRHTLMEGAQDADKERRASRTSSVGSAGGTSAAVITPLGRSRDPPNDKSLSDDKQSLFSRASTVVITESELSSSWLYNNKKAQIDATNETTLDPKGQMTSNSLENLIPETRPDPRPKSTPIPTARPIRQTSCCCHLTIALFICLTTLGILTAIAGIIYMEVFTAYVEKSHHSTTELIHGHEEIGNGIVNSSAEAAYNEAERTLDETLQNDRTAPFDVFDVAETELYEKIGSNTASKFGKGHLSELESNSSDIRNENKLNHDPNENDSTTIPDGKDSTRKGDNRQSLEDLSDSSRSNGISLPEITKELSDHEKLDLFMNYNDQLKKHFVNENQIPRKLPVVTNSISGAEIVQNNNDFVEQELHNNFENSSNSAIDNMANNWSDTNVPDLNSDDTLQVAQGQLAYLPFDKVTGDNEGNMPESDFDLSNENSRHFVDLKTDPVLPWNIHHEGMETSDDPVGKDSGSFDLNRGDTVSNVSTEQQVAENPLVAESKAVPFEFFRRLGFNRASMIAHPALTVDDMNVKFSLGEALKYLRSLDANKLPTPRTKSHIPQNNRSPKKMADAGKEREEYLMKLRKSMLKENLL